jgi:biopolymer transport protein ExbB
MFQMMSAVMAQAADAAVPAATAEPSRTLFQYIREGGVIGAILIFLSVVALTLIIMHIIQVRRTALVPVDAATELQRLFRENDIQGAIRYCERGDSFLVRVFGSALVRCSRSPFGFMEIRTALEESGQREADRLNRTIDWIGLIAAVAPMLGLLGTTIGMIGAFNSIGQLEGAARSRELAGFMSLALVNTAEGLAVAIPCTAAFSMLRRRLDRMVADAGEVVENLAVYIENPATATPKAAAQRPAPRPVTPMPVSPVVGVNPGVRPT